MVTQQWKWIERYKTVHLEMVKMVDFILCMFYRNKRKKLFVLCFLQLEMQLVQVCNIESALGFFPEF